LETGGAHDIPRCECPLFRPSLIYFFTSHWQCLHWQGEHGQFFPANAVAETAPNVVSAANMIAINFFMVFNPFLKKFWFISSKRFVIPAKNVRG
jgi:hypothetical protein